MSNFLTLDSNIFLKCHSSDGERIKLYSCFQPYLEELSHLKSIDVRYYHVLFTLFDNFITPSNQEEYQTSKDSLREDATEQILKRFRCSEEDLSNHVLFLNFLEELLNFDYEKLKTFRGYFLEYIIYEYGDTLFEIRSDSSKNLKFVEPEMMIQNDRRVIERMYGSFENDIDVGIANIDSSNKKVCKLALIECKAAIDPFTRNLVNYLMGKNNDKTEFNKVSLMKHVHQNYRSNFEDFILYLATYQTYADIYYLHKIKKDSHFLISFLQEDVNIIDFHKLIALVAS